MYILYVKLYALGLGLNISWVLHFYKIESTFHKETSCQIQLHLYCLVLEIIDDLFKLDYRQIGHSLFDVC